MRTFYFWPCLVLICALSAACGDDLARVSEGDIGEIDDIVFGQTLIGRENSQQFRIRNNGDGDLVIENIEIRDASPFIRFQDGFVANMRVQHDWIAITPGHQSFSEHPPFILESGREIQVDVIFAPDSTDLQCPSGDPSVSCGTIVIQSDDRDTATIEVNVALSQSAGRINVEPTVLEFPAVDDIVGPQQREFEITNIGAGPLTGITVTDPSVPGIQLQEDSNRPEPFALDVGEISTYIVTFTPIPGEEYCPDGVEDCTLGQIVVDSDDVEGAQTIVTLLAGGGTVPDLELSATELVFDAAIGDPDTQTLDVSNVGGSNLNWNLRIDPAGVRALFAVAVNGTSYPPSGSQIPALAAENTATVEITLDPVDEEPVRGELVITAINDPDEGLTRVQLFGGPPAAELLVEPTQLYFHNIAPEESTSLQLLLQNTGRATLTIDQATLAGSTEFTVDPDPVGDIPPGGGLPLTVTYTRPDGDLGGLDHATYTLVSNALEPNDSYLINLFAYHSTNALPPTAVINAIPSEPYAVDQTIGLDASDSTAPEGGTLPTNPYQWALIARPGTSEAVLSNNFETTTTLTPDVVGTYTVLLTVTATIDGTTPVERTQGQVTRNLLVQ